MDGELNIPVLQVVGYKNSGKTGLIEKMLAAARKKGYQAGVIKHHGHGDGIGSKDREKDTGRFRNSGAVVSGISAGNQLELRLAGESPWKIENIVELYQQLPIDFILVEGFKQASFPKVIMVRKEEDYEPLYQLQNVMAVITWDRELEAPYDVPIYHFSEEAQYLSYILTRLGVEASA